MVIVKGVIEDIEYQNNSAGYEKKIVTLFNDSNERCFVEFRGKGMDMLHGYKQNDDISVKIKFEGKISKNSGIRYNNLVAQEILTRRD